MGIMFPFFFILFYIYSYIYVCYNVEKLLEVDPYAN
jgi:hypothetical protein